MDQPKELTLTSFKYKLPGGESDLRKSRLNELEIFCLMIVRIDVLLVVLFKWTEDEGFVFQKLNVTFLIR